MTNINAALVLHLGVMLHTGFCAKSLFIYFLPFWFPADICSDFFGEPFLIEGQDCTV